MSDLNIIVPPAVSVSVGGKDVAVRPLRVRQIQPVLTALGPVLREGFAGDLTDAGAWMAFLGTHGDRIIAAVAAATDQPVDWLGDLEPGELVTLALAVVEANQDFFSRQVTPSMERLTRTLEKMTQSTAGSTSAPTADFAPQK